MIITLYTPDGTADTYRDCVVQDGIPSLLTFEGTDWNDVRRKKVTTLPYIIDTTDPEPPARTLVDRVSALLDQYETRGIQ